MRHGAISSKDLFGQENPHNVMSASYGLAMLALKGGGSEEQRVEALDRLLAQHNFKPNELFNLPDRSAALQMLADKAKIKLTITPGVIEGFNQVLNALVRRKTNELQGQVQKTQQEIGSINQRLAAESVVETLLESRPIEDRLRRLRVRQGKHIETGEPLPEEEAYRQHLRHES